MSPMLKIIWEQNQWERQRPAAQKTRSKSAVYEDRIIEAFGIDFMDAFIAALAEGQAEEIANAYEQGFLAAFQLWMEVFAQYPPE